MAKKNQKFIVFRMKMPPKYDFWLHLSSIFLIIFGSLMILSTSVGRQSWEAVVIAFVKQIVYVIVSYFLMLFMANNFTMLKAKKLYRIIGILLLLACLSTLLFDPVYGSRAWIRIGSITIQPAEFVKVFMFVVIALFIELVGRKNYDWWTIVRTPFFYLCGFLIIVMLQKDLGTLVIIMMISLICMLLPSHRNLQVLQRLIKCGLCAGFALTLFFMTSTGIQFLEALPSSLSHVSTRFENAMNPFLDPYNEGYQPIQGLVGIASGGLKGKGLGASQQKYGFLTQADNDYILAIVIEELGLGGLLCIIIGYSILIYRLFYYAFRTKSEGYKIILIGTSMYIFLHFFLNVGGVGGLIPLTGVPLLFVSSGGSSLMAILSALGICQAIISRIRRQAE